MDTKPKSDKYTKRLASDTISALNIRCVHPITRQRFKAWCAVRGVSMEQALVQVIEAIVVGNLKPTVTSSKASVN